jgi:hypothetical protein
VFFLGQLFPQFAIEARAHFDEIAFFFDLPQRLNPERVLIDGQDPAQ